jgi:hypothetical protein
MAEWSMAVVLKTTEPETVPGVRIPLSPPAFAALRSIAAAKADVLYGRRKWGACVTA